MRIVAGIAAITAVAMTAGHSTEPSQAWLAKELGIAESLTKPVTSSRLLASMARYEKAKDVLIVDDDREFVQLICRYLLSSGRRATLGPVD